MGLVKTPQWISKFGRGSFPGGFARAPGERAVTVAAARRATADRPKANRSRKPVKVDEVLRLRIGIPPKAGSVEDHTNREGRFPGGGGVEKGAPIVEKVARRRGLWGGWGAYGWRVLWGSYRVFLMVADPKGFEAGAREADERGE
jgi:hypothetical protein